ncbi:unnamed protein product [Symbiodinium sp. CCMP2456]|nr:unnamed protein product [Symbiodinium sp. CCMP2456]
MDLNSCWRAELFEVLSLRSFLPHTRMQPNRIHVRRMREHDGPLICWKGAAAEAADRDSTRDQKARHAARQSKQRQSQQPQPRQRPHLPPLMLQQASQSAVQPEHGDGVSEEPAPESPDFPDGVPELGPEDFGAGEAGAGLDLDPDMEFLFQSDSETEATPAWLQQASEIMDLEFLSGYADAVPAEETELPEEDIADLPQGDPVVAPAPASASAAVSSSDRMQSDPTGADGPAAAAVAGPAANRPPAGSRHVADVVVDVPGVGDIRFYTKNQVLVASCRRPEHQNFYSDTGSVLTCSRKRTVRAAAKLAKDVRKRSGQGRPLGHLMRWLECGCEAADQQQHVLHARSFDRDERRAARARLASLPGAEDLFAKERSRLDWESDDEPRNI